MRRRLWLLSAATAFAADLKQLYDTYRWFELRDGLTSDAPALYRGAAAAAFKEIDSAATILRNEPRAGLPDRGISGEPQRRIRAPEEKRSRERVSSRQAGA